MTAGRVLATQQARDAAKQLLSLTGTVREQVRRVLQHGGVLADPSQWEGSLAGRWRHDWGPDANQLNQAVAKLDELDHKAQQVVEDIFKADAALVAGAMQDQPPSDPPGLHDDLLEKYQVAPDPDGMTEWPPSWLPGPSMKVTATEADMLTELQIRQGLRGTKAAYDNTAHERNPDSHPTPVAMDLHNNEVGRRIALENPDADQEELRSLVEQAVRDGEMVVVGTDNRLHHSDQVNPGDTRATRENPWPTDNPQRREHRDPGRARRRP